MEIKFEKSELVEILEKEYDYLAVVVIRLRKKWFDKCPVCNVRLNIFKFRWKLSLFSHIYLYRCGEICPICKNISINVTPIKPSLVEKIDKELREIITKSSPFENKHKGIDGSRITLYSEAFYGMTTVMGLYFSETNHIWLNPIYLEDDDEWISGLISHEFFHMLFHNLKMMEIVSSLDSLCDKNRRTNKGKYKHGIDYSGIGSFRKDGENNV